LTWAVTVGTVCARDMPENNRAEAAHHKSILCILHLLPDINPGFVQSSCWDLPGCVCGVDLYRLRRIGYSGSHQFAEESLRMSNKAAVLMLWMFVLAVPRAGNLWAQGEKKEAPPELKFKVGDLAPDFKLLDQNRKEVKLSDFRGKKNVALAFYVFAFTGG
jgi:AhpC/TSA family protein